MNHNLRLPLLLFFFLGPCALALEPCLAQPRRIDPFSPDVGQFIKLGEMNGSGFDGKIWPIGDCDRDGLNDWILHRVREDTMVNHFGSMKQPEELLLFRGVSGSIPSVIEGIRIGPPEAATRAEVVTWGDWNHDNAIDLVLNVAWHNDSSYGEYFRYFFHLIVYWGQEDGSWSAVDTTHLSSGFSDLYSFVPSGIGNQDISGDDVDDLVIYTGAAMGYTRGKGNVTIPRLQIFVGGVGKRWGHNGEPRTPVWSWWNTPIVSRLGDKLIDQDCDDAPDVVLYHDEALVNHVSVLYGTPGGGLPDTNNVETLDLSIPGPPAETAQLVDVTGDHVLDLVVLDDLTQVSIESQRIRVYPGEPGMRLSAMYGTGLDPWANFPTPGVLHDGWGGLRKRIYDLGTANPRFRPGNRDIYAYHHPFLISYTTGVVLDSLIDGFYRFDGLGPQTFVNLGNIDGSDRPTIAVGYGSMNFGSGVIYLKGSDSIVGYGYGAGHRLPHPPGIRCSSLVSVVSGEEPEQTYEAQPDLTTMHTSTLNRGGGQ